MSPLALSPDYPIFPRKTPSGTTVSGAEAHRTPAKGRGNDFPNRPNPGSRLAKPRSRRRRLFSITQRSKSPRGAHPGCPAAVRTPDTPDTPDRNRPITQRSKSPRGAHPGCPATLRRPRRPGGPPADRAVGPGHGPPRRAARAPGHARPRRLPLAPQRRPRRQLPRHRPGPLRQPGHRLPSDGPLQQLGRLGNPAGEYRDGFSPLLAGRPLDECFALR
jgi:hypothetical protein